MRLIAILAAVLLAGCNPSEVTKPSYAADQCLRADLFKQCMASLPAGPASTKYNDWSEVVSECGSQAYYQSLRNRSLVKPECRSD